MDVFSKRLARSFVCATLCVVVESAVLGQIPSTRPQQEVAGIRVPDAEPASQRLFAGVAGGRLEDFSNRGTVALLDELRLRHRIEPLDGSYILPNPGDESLLAIPLRDLDHPDRALHLYTWPANGQYLFLQIDGTEPFRELHLWSGTNDEIVVTQTEGAKVSTSKSTDTFRISSRVLAAAKTNPLLSVGDVLGCLSNSLGGLSTSFLSDQLSQVTCSTLTTLAFLLTANACITAASNVFLNPLPDAACVIGMGKLVSCGVANCGPSGGCTAAPTAPAGLTASSSGGSVVLAWQPSSGSPTTYIIQAGSVPGGTNLANLETNSTSATFSASGVPTGTYYVRVRAKNGCGTSGASNEFVLTIGSTTPVAINVTGTWVGTVSSTDGPGSIVLTLTQSGSAVSGSMTLTQSGITSGGTLSGTLTQMGLASASVTWSIRYSYPSSFGLPCQGTFGGPATATATTIQGTYSGSDCQHSFSNGVLSVRRP